MPRTKNVAHYPREYWDIIEKVATEGKTMRIPCDSRTDALKLRGHFYAFVGAMRAHAEKGETEHKRLEGLKGSALQMGEELRRTLDLATASSRVLVQVEDQSLAFINRDDSWQAKMARRVTMEDGSPSSTLEMDAAASQARLMAKLGLTEEGK